MKLEILLMSRGHPVLAKVSFASHRQCWSCDSFSFPLLGFFPFPHYSLRGLQAQSVLLTREVHEASYVWTEPLLGHAGCVGARIEMRSGPPIQPQSSIALLGDQSPSGPLEVG